MAHRQRHEREQLLDERLHHRARERLAYDNAAERVAHEATTRTQTNAVNMSSDLVQIVTNDFKTVLRGENHWLLFAPIPVVIHEATRPVTPRFVASMPFKVSRIGGITL